MYTVKISLQINIKISIDSPLRKQTIDRLDFILKKKN